MKDVEGLANLCKVKLQILKSFILHPDVKSLIFDAKDSLNPNFYIGQALNFEIFDQNDKILCNDVCLSSNSKLKVISWKPFLLLHFFKYF